MAKLLDSVKALGEKITGEKINGDTLFAAVKDAGEKMTGKEIEGKELNDLIAETAKEYQGGGGTVVVDELPETGEEHTIYELHEQVEPAYNWVAYTPFVLEDDGFSISMVAGKTFIFDTYEQMTGVFENITQPEEPSMFYFSYIRNEDKLYTMQPNGENWSFEERGKLSAYTFGRPDREVGNIYILKSYEGYDEATDKYYGTLYNDTKVELFHNQDVCFILTQVVDYGQMDFAFLLNKYNPHPVTQLPTAQEAVENYLDDLIAGNGSMAVEIDGQLKGCMGKNRNYHWANDPDIGAPNFYTRGEAPVVYTGELEWKVIPSEAVFDTIPYQGIIDEETGGWEFHPSKGGEKVSYWIYANNTWTNTEDIGKPVEQEVIYGELLEGPNFSTDHKFISPYTNEQICNYLAEGKPVILRYHPKFMGENQFMYINIYDFNDTEMDVEYVNQPLHYDNFTCREYTTTDRIMYNYGSDYFYYELGE